MSVTVVVPAHDEEAVIGRCLDRMLREAEPGELKVVVVANGTTDRTLEVARAAGRALGHEVETLDLPAPSKIAAVRAGVARAEGAVAVVDADVEVPTRALRAVAAALASDRPVVAAPTLAVDASAASWVVRRYVRAWTALPYVARSMVGSGVFALNAPALERLGELPEVTNDDGWVRRRFAPHERVVVPETFTSYAARSVHALVARRARIVNGNRNLDGALGGRDAGRNGLGALVRAVRDGVVGPLDATVFLAVTAASRAVAARRR
ncbi:glycosyltransferase, partial [Actinotalea fermentans]|uniref:glycosyltransferase n=1 Tax=Actinotalea fermentans TaxID=43671 RepID=UPI0011BF888F